MTNQNNKEGPVANAHRTLDAKLARIRDGAYRPTDFIIADAKDGDMGGGAGSPGPVRDAAGRPGDVMLTAADYRKGMADMIAGGDVDIMLTSVAAAEALAASGAYEGSAVTPAVRLNDTTDIWGYRGASYRSEPALPFRTARIDRARALCDLGLYAVTFYNDRDIDVVTLDAQDRIAWIRGAFDADDRNTLDHVERANAISVIGPADTIADHTCRGATVLEGHMLDATGSPDKIDRNTEQPRANREGEGLCLARVVVVHLTEDEVRQSSQRQ